MEHTPGARLEVESETGWIAETNQDAEVQPTTDIAVLLAAALRDLDAVDCPSDQLGDHPGPMVDALTTVSEHAISVGGVAIGGAAQSEQPDNFRSAWRNRAKPIEPAHVPMADEALVDPFQALPVVPPLFQDQPQDQAQDQPQDQPLSLPIPAPLTWSTPLQTAPVAIHSSTAPTAAPAIPAVGLLPPPPSIATPWAIQAPGSPAQLPFGSVPQGPGFVPGFAPGFAPPYPQNKRKVWPWVLGGCIITFFVFSVMIIGAVSLLGQKVEQTFNTLPYTVPAYSSPAESSAPSLPFPGSALEIPQAGQCGNSPEGTVYFQPIDCALEHDASVLFASNFQTGTPASDPGLVEFTQTCASVAANEATSATNTYIDLIYGLPNGVEELHVCVLRQPVVPEGFESISNTLPN